MDSRFSNTFGTLSGRPPAVVSAEEVAMKELRSKANLVEYLLDLKKGVANPNTSGKPQSEKEVVDRFNAVAQKLVFSERKEILFPFDEAQDFWENPPWYILALFSQKTLATHLSMQFGYEYLPDEEYEILVHNSDNFDPWTKTALSFSKEEGIYIKTWVGDMSLLALKSGPEPRNFPFGLVDFIGMLLKDGLQPVNLEDVVVDYDWVHK